MRATPATWRDTKERDGDQCVRCGTAFNLTHQHRQAVGMGGSKIPPTITQSLTLCLDCNVRCERDLQTMALVYGWKVRRSVSDAALVPVFYPHRQGWARLTAGGEALAIHATEAVEMMRAVYGEQWDRWAEEVGALAPWRR